ncbi:MAG: hypothetical protein QXO32_06335 [Candidatus Bathyarchaeia archaeon]
MPAFRAQGLPAFKRRIRKAVAVDETKLKAIGCQIYARGRQRSASKGGSVRLRKPC